MRSNHQATVRNNGYNQRYLKIQNNTQQLQSEVSRGVIINNQKRTIFSRIRNFLACLQPDTSSFLLLRVDISGLRNMKKIFPQTQIASPGYIRIGLSLFTFPPFNLIRHFLIFQAPYVLTTFRSMFMIRKLPIRFRFSLILVPCFRDLDYFFSLVSFVFFFQFPAGPSFGEC